MGRFALSGVFVALLVSLGACERPTSAASLTGGVTIICPGDRRCIDVEPPPFTEALPPPVSGEDPRIRTCLVQGSVAVLRCRDDRPCPGAGCPNGQDPGDPQRECRLRDTYVFLNCDRPTSVSPPPPPPPPVGDAIICPGDRRCID